MQLLRKLLFPFSLVYALVVYIRNFLYDIGVFKSERYDTPTVCIGNLSVGGTGKTPMTELVIDILRDTSKLAVLSRGYKRKSKGFVLAQADSTVEEIGDEPFQIFSKFPEVTVAVDADRRNGIRELEKKIHPAMILLDDAYQHRKVLPHFSILLTAYGDLYTDDWYLPTGNLRDSKYAANRANLIVVTKCPSDITGQEQERIVNKIGPKKNQQVLFAHLAYDQDLKHGATTVGLNTFKDKKVSLVTGIANPAPLVAYLKNKGLEFDHLSFGDHHFFSENEIDRLKTKEVIITTEKDYVRLSDKLDNLYYLPVKHVLLNNGYKVLKEQLFQLMNGIS
ncbi:tetraacyldisaccharide 4'-kinase [Maribacter thermophilus]|uniref:tetraacyldisaccharide 4'-kinase n=1 Tax=Maribacter thermophilus TaxID=1197874 RepID=UPI000640EEE4|nr:tetraacyldisaccharide 4'-kinase [Maribacter thermophilus]